MDSASRKRKHNLEKGYDGLHGNGEKGDFAGTENRRGALLVRELKW